MRFASLLLFLLTVSGTVTAAKNAGKPPDLNNQERWNDADKKKFLDYLRSGESLFNGIGDKLVTANGNGGPALKLHKARFLTLAPFTDTLLIQNAERKIETESTTVGGQILIGTHIFSWVRCFAGARYSAYRRDRLDGDRSKIEHLHLPAGIEFALIPLGTPQTRYIILRLGGAAHHFLTAAEKSDFRLDLIDWRYSWNAGLGYEWQIPDSRWRLHLAAEGYRSIEEKKGDLRFFGTGASLGLVLTF